MTDRSCVSSRPTVSLSHRPYSPPVRPPSASVTFSATDSHLATSPDCSSSRAACSQPSETSAILVHLTMPSSSSPAHEAAGALPVAPIDTPAPAMTRTWPASSWRRRSSRRSPSFMDRAIDRDRVHSIALPALPCYPRRWIDAKREREPRWASATPISPAWRALSRDRPGRPMGQERLDSSQVIAATLAAPAFAGVSGETSVRHEAWCSQAREAR